MIGDWETLRRSALFFIHRPLILAAQLGLQTAEAIRFPVDELADLSQCRVHFLNPAPHLLADETVVAELPGNPTPILNSGGDFLS